jgi:hypothetical protein
MHCRSEPHQEGVPTSSPRRGTPPHVDASGWFRTAPAAPGHRGELDPTEIVGDGLRAACVWCHGLGGAHGRVALVAKLSRRDDDPMPTTERTSRWSGTRSWSVSSRRRARDDLGVSGSMGRCPPDYDPAAGTGHHPTRRISRRPRPGRISPPEGGEPEAGERGDDHLERLGRVAAVGARVGQGVDDLGPVPERPGPAVARAEPTARSAKSDSSPPRPPASTSQGSWPSSGSPVAARRPRSPTGSVWTSNDHASGVATLPRRGNGCG